MLCRCLCPFFCSSMIICIYFSILNMANITNCLLRTGCISTCMDAVISADTTMTVFPIMGFYISTIGTAAVIFFLMCFCCLFPYFIAVMICRVYCAVFCITFCADGSLFTCCLSSRTVCCFYFCTSCSYTFAGMRTITV